MSYAQTVASRDESVRLLPNTRVKNQDTTRVIFLAGDFIPAHEKFEMPDIKGFGGAYMSELQTLPIPPPGSPNGMRHMLYRCTFTPLRTKFKADWETMVHPDQRDAWAKEFIQTINGQETHIKGFIGSDARALKEDGELRPKKSSHLSFKQRYPGHDVRLATRRSQPHGLGGIVEITALQGATQDEIDAVQLFFFPQWEEIKMGLADLPIKMKEMEQHIRTRTLAINSQPWDMEQKGRYLAISKDMLKSCSEFMRTGTQVIELDEQQVKKAEKEGGTAHHSAISEFLLSQLNYQRKGDLIAGQSSAVDKLADIMLKKEESGDALKHRELDIEERKLFLEEVKLGIRNPDGTLKAGPAVEADTDGDGSPDFGTVEDEMFKAREAEVLPRLCGQPKANGEPCERALKDGELSCFQHPIE